MNTAATDLARTCVIRQCRGCGKQFLAKDLIDKRCAQCVCVDRIWHAECPPPEATEDGVQGGQGREPREIAWASVAFLWAMTLLAVVGIVGALYALLDASLRGGR